MSEFLRVENITKSFPYGEGRLEVLKGISFSLSKGEIVSIMGASGSGKSTLLHIVGGMETPDSGAVLLNGESVYSMSHHERALFRNRSIGFVFQFHHLLPEFNAIENLIMPLLIRGMPPSEAMEKGKKLMEDIGLSHRLISRPGQLSGGEQQRLAVGRALITSPSLLLLDEPTGNLDLKAGEEIMDLVFSLLEKYEISAILVTHNPDIARKCPKILEMREGKLQE